MEKPPSWRLPEGVSSSLWDYIHSSEVASEYDQRLTNSPLLQQDAAFVHKHTPSPGKLIDLGCGTGRMLSECGRRGHWVLGVDLSEGMLAQAQRRAQSEGLSIQLLKSNLVDLSSLAPESFDYAVCLFSTLGMIQGDRNRRRALAAAHRLLKPGGLFIVHVHNRWFSIWEAAGRRWLIADGWRQVRRGVTAGDRPMPPHQGVAGLALHHFTRREIVKLLEQAGFAILEVRPVGLEHDGSLRHPWLAPGFRAYGYLLAARRLPYETVFSASESA
jgi:ubiquinone/menaquinone biosynthesis C-methylase UbiE